MKKWALIELSKTKGLILVKEFQSKEEAQIEMDNQISTWTHWDKPGCPCQKEFSINEVA